MTLADATASSAYELPLPGAQPPVAPAAWGRASLPEDLLVRNVQWFCRLRWVVVGILGAFGVLGLFPSVLAHVGFHPFPDWPLVAGGILALGNAGFYGLARWVHGPSAARHARIHLWGQIVFDLLILTGVVHFVGSLETSIAFAYLFHIVLACIFLSGRESLAVTLLACVLYAGCVAAEAAGILTPHLVYAGVAAWSGVGQTPWVPIWNMAMALAIWLAVWYLACHLSTMVRDRDQELATSNRRLEAALDERSKHMLRTTHELKAPFAAIHATTQVLLDGRCGALPEEAQMFIRRISIRCRRLANEIQEMVQLANLRSESQGSLPSTALDAAEILQWCVGQVHPLAEERRVKISTEIRPARTLGVEDHLKMLFSNILGNAIVYSHEGGQVRVACGPDEAGRPVAVIEDHGIGIPAEKLPHIFEEYYRTDEAVRHNKQSSGLGLAIVRHVAQKHGIGIRVESRPGVGTTFRLWLPSAEQGSGTGSREKEKPDGLHHDR